MICYRQRMYGHEENNYFKINCKRAAIICTDHCIYTYYLRDNITSDTALTSTYSMELK